MLYDNRFPPRGINAVVIWIRLCLEMKWNIYLKCMYERWPCFNIFLLGFIVDHIFDPRKVMLFVCYLFSTELYPMPSMILCYICRVKTWTFHICIPAPNLLKLAYRMTVFFTQILRTCFIDTRILVWH